MKRRGTEQPGLPRGWKNLFELGRGADREIEFGGPQTPALPGVVVYRIPFPRQPYREQCVIFQSFDFLFLVFQALSPPNTCIPATISRPGSPWLFDPCKKHNCVGGTGIIPVPMLTFCMQFLVVDVADISMSIPLT